MPKLPQQDQFVDFSDYGRPFGRWIAKTLKNTWVSPVQITLSFTVVGLLAVFCIMSYKNILALILLILKSSIDAADGELARIRNRPSYTGRYTDSIADLILNFILLCAIGFKYENSLVLTLIAFFFLQLQGTVYNYYYVIVRNLRHGDNTSQVFETTAPLALEGENQKVVNVLFRIYLVLYGAFDKIIYFLDPIAPKSLKYPNWFMTLISVFGLGFQLLIIGLLLAFNMGEYVVPVIVGASPFIIIFIGIRRIFIT